MTQKKLIWQLYPSYLAVTLVALIAVTGYCSHYFRRVYHDQVREALHQLAGAAAEQARLVLRTEDPNGLDHLCKRFAGGGDGTMRLTIIAPSGIVLGDSHEDPAGMDNHAGRPEILEALRNGIGSSVRFSPTHGTRMMYAAAAITRDRLWAPDPRLVPGAANPDAPVAVVRAASPLMEIDRVLRSIYVHVLWAGLVIAGGAAALSLWISRGITRPIVAIKRIAERFAAGELNVRVPMPDSAELASLAGSLNKMAVQLGERIATITEQRNKLDAILSSMAEGVLAVDNRGIIVSVNPTAAKLLGLEPVRVQNRPVEEVISNAELQEFVRQALAGVPPEEMDISLCGQASSGRSIRLHGACLMDARGRRSGAVIVLNDMTRIRRLEAIRRDFVANVSHELKTPVTSIQGFVEALVDGGVQDPTQVERYLGIIAKHASRLNRIIDDLLALSRLEETGQRRALTFAHCPVKPVLEEAIDLAGVRADAKRMMIDLVCDDDLEARLNAPLLEQAVTNLLDNAIKYSPEGSRIRVEARVGAGRVPKRDVSRLGSRLPPHVSISVADEGCGIAEEHLARLFERFYVVDKSRSRKLGGTGLGLAIVKHIAQAHGGRITVESTPDKGSTFTLHLPI